jgi:hypothetical protein
MKTTLNAIAIIILAITVLVSVYKLNQKIDNYRSSMNESTQETYEYLYKELQKRPEYSELPREVLKANFENACDKRKGVTKVYTPPFSLFGNHDEIINATYKCVLTGEVLTAKDLIK